MRKALLVAAAVAGVMATSVAKPLRFKADGTFKIVQLTDIHWQPGNAVCDSVIINIGNILDAEQPDLVVYTGDLAWASPAGEAVRSALEPVAERKLPFAVVWGNHDREFGTSGAELFDIVRSYPTNVNPEVEGISGETNGVIEIKGAKTDAAASVIYLFDSHGNSAVPAIRGYAGIQPDQVVWYEAESRKMTEGRGGEPMAGLAFCHVPPCEVNAAVADEYAAMTGTRRERACTPAVNNGIFAAMLRCGDVMGVFFGHDHINDYAVGYKGVLLAYGRYSGAKTVYCDMPGGPGARVIELGEGRRGFDTWIRLADGSKIQSTAFPHDYTRWKESANE